ncbi:MAG: 4Fe-4S binding protein [Ruminiclostridium sp.]
MNNNECILCGNCENMCPKKAIHMGVKVKGNASSNSSLRDFSK